MIAKKSPLRFLSFRFIEKLEKGFEKLLQNSGRAPTRIISRNETTVLENSFADPFSDFPIKR